MRRQIKSKWVYLMIPAFVIAFLCYSGPMNAGDLDPPGSPGSTMKPLDEVPPAWSQMIPASERFEVVLNGKAVLDKETGLVWEKSPSKNKVDWYAALGHCAQLNILRMGWRLPAVEELASLIDGAQLGLPSGHPFDNVDSTNYYWSSSTLQGDGNSAWHVMFSGASVAFYGKSNSNSDYAWCVRGGYGHDAY